MRKVVEKQVTKHFSSASAVHQFKSEAVKNITQKAERAHTTPNLTPKAIKNEAHRIKQGKVQQWEKRVNVGINSATQAGADAFIRIIDNNNK